MAFSKKDIQRARDDLYLKKAQNQLGKHIISLGQVQIVNPLPKKQVSLGDKLLINQKKIMKRMTNF
jgi:hypothetical protein